MGGEGIVGGLLLKDGVYGFGVFGWIGDISGEIECSGWV